MLSRIADKLVLCPSRFPIPTPNKTRRLVSTKRGPVEVWIETVHESNTSSNSQQTELFILKFPGTGGRAERTTRDPLDYWEDVSGEVWAVNAPGYGCSAGRASLKSLAPTARAVYSQLAKTASGRPIVVVGNSLGTAPALYLASTCKVAGLILRNPPPLRQIICSRHRWWNLGLASRLVAAQVPHELNSIFHAGQCRAPTLFIVSQKDRIVPVRFQQQIIEAYAGPKQVLPLAEADHATPISPEEIVRYEHLLDWFRSTVLPGTAARATLSADFESDLRV